MLFRSLGVNASLLGFVVTGLVKKAQHAKPINVYGGEMQFCKSPNVRQLTEVFEKLINPPGKFFFVYFSDDSCISIRHNGSVHTYNMDIKSCDASHTGALFRAFTELAPGKAKTDLEALVEQCKSKIKICSTVDRSRKVTLKPLFPRLYSGSTLTTAINNLANIFICLAIVEGSYDGTEAYLKQAAARVGYLIDLELCTVKGDIQFLKHSPVYDTEGRLRPLLNPGVLLRLSGQCKGDLPGQGDLRQRAIDFQHTLLKGIYPDRKSVV